MTYLTSTASLSSQVRLSIADLQIRLSQAQKEQASGRHSDMSVALGSQLGQTYSLGMTLGDLQTISMTNTTVGARLDAIQSALANLSQDGSKLITSLTAAPRDAASAAPLRTQAQGVLESFSGYVNTSAGSEFVFGGINSGAAPLHEYFSSPASPAKQGVDAAFAATFGFPQSSASVVSITAAQMQSYLSGAFAGEFTAAKWATNWSSASDQVLESRISPTRVTETSVSANDSALQKIAMGYVMLSDLPLEKLSDGAYQTVVDMARQSIDEGLSGLRQLQARVGGMQSDVKNANLSMDNQQTLLTNQIGALENVDPTETAVLINQLMTQLQAAYTLTSRIQQLSLAKYI